MAAALSRMEAALRLEEIDRIATNENEKYPIKGDAVIKENETTHKVRLCSVQHCLPFVYSFTGKRDERPEWDEYEFTVIREENSGFAFLRHPTQRPIEILSVAEMSVEEESKREGKTVKPTPPKKEPLPHKTKDVWE